jgi:hypothetical protein
MSLVIAWRNPQPLARTERKVRRVVEDRFGTVYLVTEPDATQETFELYPGGGMKSDELRRGVVETGSTLASRTTKEETRGDIVCGNVAGKHQEAADPGA